MRTGALRRLFAYAGKARRLLFVGYALIVVDAVAQILVPAVFRVVLNRIQADPHSFVDGGWRGPALWATVVAATFLTAAYIAHTWTRRGAALWSHNLRTKLYEHVQHLSIDFFQRSHVGDLASRINQDIERLEVTVFHGMALVWALVMLVLGIALMAWIDIWMALVAAALLAVAAAWTLLVLPRLRRRTREVRDELGSTAGTLTELLSVNSLLKAFNAEDHAAEQIDDVSGRVLERSSSLARLQHRFTDTLALHVAFVAPFVLLFVGAWRAAEGTLLIGDVVGIWAFWQRASGALTSILNNVPEIFSGLAAGERAVEILDQDATVSDRSGAPPLTVTEATIRFDDVSFAYPGRPDEMVLQGFDLAIASGARVALVGASGAGKSTVAQLLLRFYDPTTGCVSIDGQNVRDVRQRSLREAIGVVFQDNVLLSGSLARNLRVAKPDATYDEMLWALEAANAWDFVRAWEHGLDTHVGERGVLMSGGQRQRLAIARVMLKQPAIVVLDEATSALDADSERLVLGALERLLTGRTSLVIAHRIGTIRDADHIVVMDRGRVSDEGTHDSLLRLSAIYRSYCRHQSAAG